jgi:hypothetical protein
MGLYRGGCFSSFFLFSANERYSRVGQIPDRPPSRHRAATWAAALSTEVRESDGKTTMRLISSLAVFQAMQLISRSMQSRRPEQQSLCRRRLSQSL